MIGDGVVNGHIYQQLSLDAVVHVQREPETGNREENGVKRDFPESQFLHGGLVKKLAREVRLFLDARLLSVRIRRYGYVSDISSGIWLTRFQDW
ncbi:MAG TPA: hypothetical protein EYM57_01275 [Gammaproteobacteria bacterium]|nr:hypothetical protein [Gammaproteobacteria bacterium]